MLPKRRLSEEEPESSSMVPSHNSNSSPDCVKKKKKLDPEWQISTLYDFIRRYKREDGSELCEPFIRAPKRRTDPGFYEGVSSPMDLLRIQQKMKMEEYDSLESFKQDVELMLSHWLAYFTEDSMESKNARELKELLAKALEKVEEGENPAVSLGEREGLLGEVAHLIEEFFAAVLSASAEDEPQRFLSEPFKLLPSKKLYPGYYEVIQEPIDLRGIANKIQGNVYESLTQVEEDFLLMCKNAMTFNETGSQIYRDARSIVKLVKSKRAELETARLNSRDKRAPGRTGSRRQPVRKQFSSSEIAKLEDLKEDLDEEEMDDEDEEEDSSSDEESETDEDVDEEEFPEGPMGELFKYIRNYEVAGLTICEPFLILPSKKLFPDYYTTILNPISLNIIRKKLKNKEYGKQSDMVKDMNVMFENCKAYNRSDSQIYKEGVKLQKLMHAKVEELLSGPKVPCPPPSNGEQPPVGAAPNYSGSNILALKNMRLIYNSILNYTDNTGVQLVAAFMEKPSKEDYPDYYEVIEVPMDMSTINSKIISGAYRNEEEFILDMRLIFTNCKKYNEEGSDIYKDAVTLERILNTKARELGLTAGLGRGRPSKKKLHLNERAVKMKALFDALRDYKDAKGRQLSLIFLRLPNLKEFADYYEIIKKPIDFEKINTKIKMHTYDSLEETLADFILMFDNACKYNEPDSQIYKDALTLQSLALKVAREMNETATSGASLDVSQRVQDILQALFFAVNTHADESGRSYTDSMAELPEVDVKVVNGLEVRSRALNLDIIKRRLDRQHYRRLDFFQRDVFAVLERARSISSTDSRIFDDSVQLQACFIRNRDQLTEKGAVLKSKALLYTQVHLETAISAIKAKKAALDFPSAIEDEAQQLSETKSALVGSKEYKVGEVYLVGGAQIFRIENFPSGNNPEFFLGTQFLLPKDTNHTASRKFLDREVFLSDIRKNVDFSEVSEKVAVLSVKDYMMHKPHGVAEEHIWVCESRYASKLQSFSKLKPSFDFGCRNMELIPRQTPVELRRSKSNKVAEALPAAEDQPAVEIPPNVPWTSIPYDYPLPQALDEGITYFEQYSIPGPITLKRGDNVYVRSENGKNLIVQIDTMWTSGDGMAYFHGPWFVTPSETPQNPSMSFYKQEVFLSTISDTNPLLSAVGKCTVLQVSDYTTKRPTEVAEEDVYVCESVFDETKRAVRGLLPPTGLKKYTYNSPNVLDDEIYFFQVPIHIEKAPERIAVAHPLTPKSSFPSNFDVDNEDSLDGISSVCSNNSQTESSQQKKSKGPSKKVVTAYILYSSEKRKAIVDSHKECTFGQISRIVGDQWKQLSDLEKQVYEERAKKVNKENEIKFLQEQRDFEEKKRQEMMSLIGSSTPMSFGNGYYNYSMSNAPKNNALSMISINNAHQQRPYNSVSPGSSPGPPVLSNSKVIEPIFHTVPPRPQKLLHSEAYIKYIEGLTTESHSMSNWERQLQATKENTKTDEAQLPAHWLSDNGQHGTSLDALWALREFMMSDSLGIYKL